MEAKPDPKLWATVTIAVAIIGCLGVLSSAFIGVLPDILKSSSTLITPSSTIESATSFVISSDMPTFTIVPPSTTPSETPTVFVPTFVTPSETSTIIFIPSTVTPSETPFSNNVLFQDDFSTNINGWAVGKRSYEFSEKNTEISDGQYQYSVALKDDGTYSWINIPNLITRDFSLKIDAEFIQKSKNTTGIVIAFRYINQGKSSYAVIFNGNSTFSFRVRENGTWRTIYTGKSNAYSVSEGKINTFAVTAQGQIFKFYANGQELYALSDFSITSEGEIGFGTYGQEKDSSVIMTFDNVIVTEGAGR